MARWTLVVTSGVRSSFSTAHVDQRLVGSSYLACVQSIDRVVVMETKICTKCRQDKTLDEYAHKNKLRGTRASECKSCHRAVRNVAYRNSPLPDQTRIKQRKLELKEWMDSYKTQLSCKCGENHPGCLDFHHLDPDEKEISVSHAVLRGWSRTRILLELGKCQVLCANCHRKLHWEQRYNRQV